MTLARGTKASGVLAMLGLLMAVSCSSDGSEGGSGATAESEPKSTATTAVEGLAEDDLAFVTCRPAGSGSPVADVSVFDPAAGTHETLLTGLSLCSQLGTPPETAFVTTSRRYLVAFWAGGMFGDPTFNVVDLATGQETTLTSEDLNAWATSQTGSGLDASEQRVVVTGFDRNDDGRIFLGDPNASASSSAYSWRGPLRFYAQDVAELVAQAGSLSPTELPDERWCYTSTRWSFDGSHCLLGSPKHDEFGLSYIVPTSDSPAWGSDGTDLDDISQHGYAGVNALSEDADFIDATVAVGSADDMYDGTHGVYTGGAGQQPATLYEASGDRWFAPWTNHVTGDMFVASETLDHSATEVYRLPANPGAEPELVASLPADIGIVNS